MVLLAFEIDCAPIIETKAAHMAPGCVFISSSGIHFANKAALCIPPVLKGGVSGLLETLFPLGIDVFCKGHKRGFVRPLKDGGYVGLV